MTTPTQQSERLVVIDDSGVLATITLGAAQRALQRHEVVVTDRPNVLRFVAAHRTAMITLTPAQRRALHVARSK